MPSKFCIAILDGDAEEKIKKKLIKNIKNDSIRKKDNEYLEKLQITIILQKDTLITKKNFKKK